MCQHKACSLAALLCMVVWMGCSQSDTGVNVESVVEADTEDNSDISYTPVVLASGADTVEEPLERSLAVIEKCNHKAEISLTHTGGKYMLLNNKWNWTGFPPAAPDPYCCMWYDAGAKKWGIKVDIWADFYGRIKAYPCLTWGNYFNKHTPNCDLMNPGVKVTQNLYTSAVVEAYYGDMPDRPTKINVAYDIWTNPNKMATDHEHEVMIWLHRKGFGKGDITAEIGGHRWAVSHNPPTESKSWHYYAFVPEGANFDALINLNLKDIFAFCIQQGWMNTSQYVASCQFGSEQVTGHIDLTVHHFYVGTDPDPDRDKYNTSVKVRSMP